MTLPLRVGLVFGGRSTEHQVSIRSARTVAAALARAGHIVVPLGISVDGCWIDESTSTGVLTSNTETIAAVDSPIQPTLRHLLEARLDAVFPLVHGTWGEDGTMQGLFEMVDLPYVGADVAASAIAMDKIQCKRLLEAVGVRTVESVALDRRRWDADSEACIVDIVQMGRPLFVKPAIGGSSVGVRKVVQPGELSEAIEFAFGFCDRILVERGIVGRELEVAVLGYRKLEASPVGEIVPGKDFYDYEDKYLSDSAKLEAPAALDEATSDTLRGIALRAFAAIGGNGMARVDFLLGGEGDIYVNEINTLPGFTSISMYPRLWELGGVPIDRLVDRLVEIARRRHNDRRRLNDGIRAWMRRLQRS